RHWMSAVGQGRAEEARGRGVESADGPCRRSLRRIGGELVPEAVRRQQGEVALAGRLDGIVGRRNARVEAGIELAGVDPSGARERRSEEHTSELQSRVDLVCRL